LTPVSLRQILDAKHTDQMSFTINDKPVSQVKIVGCLLNVDVATATTTYTIDDGTGILPVRIYTNDDAQEIDGGIREDVYVRVVGNIRQISGNRIVVAFQVNPIKNFNDITLHILDTIHSHLKATRGPLDEKGKPKTAASNPAPMLAAKSENYQSEGGDANLNEGMNDIQTEVMKIFETTNRGNESGTSISEVISRLPKYDAASIRGAVEFLSGEGHLYSTIDEEHFKCTSE